MIRLEHITKEFMTPTGLLRAVDDVSVHIEEGQIYGIIGFSGAGKSTLVRCINLLERPTSGRVLINDRDITTVSEAHLRKIRRGIGMIFQHFNLMPSRTVFENVALALKWSDLSKEAKERKIMELLTLVDLANKRDAYPSELSGGQKQRVAIARALANDPKVLLCDEATSALDPQTTESILKLIKEVNAKLHLTVVIITHQMSVVKSICDRVAVMEHGKVVEEGTIVDVFSNPQAPITKGFIETASNLGTFFEVFNNKEAIPESERNNPVWFLTYTGSVTGEATMVELYERFGVRASIVYGNIDFIKGMALGKLAVGLKGEADKLNEARRYLEEKGVRVEVLQ